MTEILPPHLAAWVTEQAWSMGLPGAEDYIVLLIRLEHQRQMLEPAQGPR